MSQVNVNFAALTPDVARRLVELSEENAGLEARRLEIVQEMESIMTGGGGNGPPSGGTSLPTPAPAPKPTPKPAPTANAEVPQVRRGPGRPPGSKNKPKTEDSESKEAAKSGDSVNLPTLLRDIAAKSRKSLTVDDFVKAANDANYQSKAQDFGNMVYQALQKLVGKNVLKKTVVQEENGNEKRIYDLVAA